MLTILILIYFGINMLRKNARWNLIQSLCFVAFLMSESVVAGYIQANTEPSTVLMFVNVISAMVISLGMFVSGGTPD